MKYSFYFIALFCFVTFSCNKETPVAPDEFLVEGTIKGLDSDFMTRGYKDADGNRVQDSIKITNESFSYTAKIIEPTFIIFWPNVERTIKRTKGGGYYPVKSSQFAFIASPGAHITFKGEVTDFINAYPSGDAVNNDLAAINSKIFPLMNKSVNFTLAKESIPKEDPQFQQLTDSSEFYDNQVLNLKKEFVQTKSNSKAAAWYLSDLMLRSQVTNDEAISYFNAFNKDMADDPYYKEVAGRVAGIEASKIGQIIPNFTKQDVLTNTSFEMASLKGKYVLIDFWGTWCGPCIAEMPTVKEYSEKYKDELVIVGVNQGDTEERLKTFVTKNEYNWTQLMVENNDLVLKLNVSGFPTKFIVDPEGKILYRFVGDSSASFEKLDELLSATESE